MSGSDSDLDFESADEGVINEDISDIDLSDLEEKNDDVLAPEKSEAKEEIISNKESILEVKEQTTIECERVKIDDTTKETTLEERKLTPDRVEGDDDIEKT